MEKVKERITHYSLYVTALLKWLAVGALVGGVGGFVGALFHLGVDCATNVRLAHPWILYLLPLGGVVIALLYRLCRLEGAGTNAVIESVHFGKKNTHPSGAADLRLHGHHPPVRRQRRP